MDAARAKWIAGFDMEDCIGAILARGTALGLGLIAAGMVLRWGGMAQSAAIDPIQGMNVFHFVLSELRPPGTGAPWPTALVHWGIAVLLYTPYARAVASTLYFAFVHRSWKHTVLGSLVLAPLTYILFFG